MTSRFTLLAAAAGVAGLALVGCSGADEEGDIPPAPLNPPSGMVRGAGAGGSGQVANAGAGGTGVTAGGTGGTGVAAGGTGGTGVAAGGTGGAPGGQGTGGTGSNIPVGTGAAITHDATGWVAGSTNGLGIQGSFHVISDADSTPPGNTTIALDGLDAPTSACVTGSASAVQMELYGQYWGGGLGLNLADPGGGAALGPWSRGTVTGFTFTVSGPTVPPAGQLRFKVTTLENGVVNDTGFCVNATAGANTFTFGQLVNECWAGGAGAPALGAATQLVSLQWQVATVVDDPTPFDFCIDNLTATTTP